MADDPTMGGWLDPVDPDRFMVHGEPTKQREGDQRLPDGGHQCVQDLVIAEMEESKRVGQERYGSVLKTFNGRSTIQDIAEEARDLHVYLTQVRAEAEASRETLIEVVTQALDQATTISDAQEIEHLTPWDAATIAVDRVMGWVVGRLNQGRTEDEQISIVLDIMHAQGPLTNGQVAERIVKGLRHG